MIQMLSILGYIVVIVYDNVERFVMLNNAQWVILVVAIKSFAATSAPLFILSLITRRLGVDKDSFSLFTPTFIPVLSFWLKYSLINLRHSS